MRKKQRMNKKVTDNYAALAAGLGMRFDSAHTAIYGERNGYEFVLYTTNTNYPYMFSLNTSAKSPSGVMLSKAEIRAFVHSIKRLSSMKQNGNSFTLQMAGINNQTKLLAKLNETINGLITFFGHKGYVPCCSRCGQQEETASFRLAGVYLHLCPECEARMSYDSLAAAQEKEQKHENVIAGIVGALLGSLIGVAAIVLISRMGYWACLCGAVMSVCTLKGYEKLAGKLTKKGIVIGAVIMLIMAYFADRLDWAIVVYREVGYAYGANVLDCYRLLPNLISEGMIDIGSYVLNLIMIYIFLVVGAVPAIRMRVQESQEENHFVKIGSSDNYSDLVS